MNRSKVKTATVAGGILRWPPSCPNAHGQVGLRGTVYLKAEWSSGPVWPHPNFLWLVQKMKSETQTAVKTWRSPAASKLEGASDKECRWHLGTEKGLRWANTKKAGTSIPHIWESNESESASGFLSRVSRQERSLADTRLPHLIASWEHVATACWTLDCKTGSKYVSLILSHYICGDSLFRNRKWKRSTYVLEL